MEIPKLSTSNSKFILCGPWRPVVLISSNDVWPHFLSSPAGRRWFRHSQEDGGGRLTTLIFFSSVYWRPAWRRRPAKRSLLFSKEVKNPSPSSPRLPPEPSEAKLSAGLIEHKLWATRRRILKADRRLFTESLSFYWRKAGVCVYCMFYWFFKVCGFFIFILLSVFIS